MFFINLYRFLMGYVEIILFGDFPERLLNLMAKNGITPWNIKKRNESIEICLLSRDFKKIRKIRAKSGVKVKIKAKKGFKKKFKRFKVRYGLIAGIILFFAVQEILSQFIWQIEITGNKKTESQRILSVCEELNLKNGTYKKSLDLPVLRQKLLLKLDGIAWGSINIEGCKATLNLSEIKNDNINSAPSNIVSDYDCVIKSIKVISGVGAVEKGQAVQKGNLLISGAVDSGGVPHFTKASGEILGEISDTYIFEGKYKITEKAYTGKVKHKSVLDFFSVKIPLYLGKYSGLYDTFTNTKNISFLNSPTPIFIYQKQFKEYEYKDRILSDDELVEELSEQFDNKMKELNALDIQILSLDILRTDEGVSLVYQVKFVKNIGINENLLF